MAVLLRFDRSGLNTSLDAPHAATASRRQTRSGVHSCDVTRIRFVRRTCPVACVRCDNYRGSSVFDRSGLNTSLDAPHAATASRWQNALRCTFLRRYEDAFRSQAVACSVRTAQFNFLNENITRLSPAGDTDRLDQHPSPPLIVGRMVRLFPTVRVRFVKSVVNFLCWVTSR